MSSSPGWVKSQKPDSKSHEYIAAVGKKGWKKKNINIHTCMKHFIAKCNRPYAYDVINLIAPSLGEYIRLHINAVVPTADHKRTQGNDFCPPHGSTMTSIHKVYYGYLKNKCEIMPSEYKVIGGLWEITETRLKIT